MEVKHGYRQTDVGLLPADWDAGLIDRAVERLEAGASVNSDKDETPDFASYPCVLKTGAAKDGSLDPLESKKVARRDLWRLKVALRKDTILISRMNTVELVGESGYVDADYPNLFVPDRMWMATLRATVHPRWFSYVLTWQPVKSRISASATGTSGSMKNISKPSLRAVRVPYPPVEEQRAISTALGDVDALLGGLDRLIAKKRDLKQAAMQQLLTGQTRLPGFHGEWEVKTLFDLAERKKELFDDGDWIESEHITTEGIRLIQTGNIGIGSFIEKEIKKFIYEKSFTSLRCKQLRTGDLLVCRLADPAGRACVLPDIGEERIVTSVDVTIFRPPLEMADRAFLMNVFSTPEWFRAVSDRSGGTTHKRISRGALGRIAIKLPPLAEQTAIAAVLSDMDAELAALEARRDKTRDLKQAMMQELLTGKTRLVPAGAAHA